MTRGELIREVAARREMIEHLRELITFTNQFELVATAIIFILCFAIYLKIHSLYTLTYHKGINYFQKGFLFFSFSYLLSFIQLSAKMLHYPLIFKFPLVFGLIGIFQLLGITYLLSSMFSKHIKEWHIILSVPLITILGILLHSRELIYGYSIILILALGYVSYLKLKDNKSKHKKMFSHIYVIYLLIFLSWIIQIMSRIVIEMKFISKIFYLGSSLLIFSYIFYIVYQKIMRVEGK